MILKPYQSLLVKSWNVVSKLKSSSNTTPRITVEGIMADAIKIAGTSDFGTLSFIDALTRLIDELNATANLHPFGWFYLKKLLTTQLVNRLQVTACITQHPEILKQPIQKPIIILGLPRTGSSFLFNLLAQDPNHRYMKNWEAVVSQVPPPGIYGHANDPRRRISKRLLTFQNYLAPEMKSRHDFTVDGPEECTPILMQSFTLSVYGNMFHIPKFLDWLPTQSRKAMYQQHKRILQTLQWKYPKPQWILKSPAHLEGLKELLAVYPDARLIHTHRDPVKSVPSCASLSATFQGITAESIDTTNLGKQTLRMMIDWYKNFIAQRDHIPSSQLIDISYTDLTRDPMAITQQIYQYFGLPWSDDLQKTMQFFLSQDRSPKRKHQYDTQQFGLTASEIHKKFTFLSAPHSPTPHPVIQKSSVSLSN